MKTDLWRSDLYDNHHQFVSAYGKDIVSLLDPKQEEYILDAGCGTGDLTNDIAQSGAIVHGIDQSSNMIEAAKGKYPALSFSVNDILHLQDENTYDAFFSNAVLHWINRPQEALENIYQSLKSKGRMVVEFGGKGNVENIRQAIHQNYHKLYPDFEPLQEPWYFPSIGEYTAQMEKANFSVVQAVHYKRPTPLQGEDGLRNWMKMFAHSMLVDLTYEEKERLFDAVEQQLKPVLYQNQQWMADYYRLQVIAIKPSFSSNVSREKT
ncbi:type 11 methyltransferase [Gracilibacillus halophilus YIM-C55.5]|uniref:Type 11 methyltransferase n=1 Tax=Gracilibacillus halophilus YIM-C55.5 TaxID=1308866 RepID=N4WA28_9BACI|nr:class I SAM-dependent methyltransferase [Gracilibacillus halophilus]ENH96104.1 type 11 methyltransferase [Gracilibacillus halophilus YIM-C55.5]